MNVRQCSNCRKLYQYNGSLLCVNCVEELDKLFNDVRNYIEENPNADLDELREKTGTDGAIIVRWLREGRLMMATASGLIKCDICGQSLRSGRFCEKCATNVKEQLQSVTKTFSNSTTLERKVSDRKSDVRRMHVNLRKN